MPIKPQPIQYTCRDCGWKTVYAPPSDAVLTPPTRSCGKCENDKIRQKSPLCLREWVFMMFGLEKSAAGQTTPDPAC